MPLSLSVIGCPKRSRLLPAATRIQPSDTEYSMTLVFSWPLNLMPTPRLRSASSKCSLRGSRDRRSGGVSVMSAMSAPLKRGARCGNASWPHFAGVSSICRT